MNLDELKKKLFAALPPAVREKLGIELDDEEYDEDEEIDVDSEEATASHDVEGMEAGEEAGEDDEEDDEEAEKKAKRSKIIRGVVILAIAYFALDEFMAEPEMEVPDVKIVRPKRPPRPAETPAEIPTEQTPAVTPEIVQEEETPIAVETPEVIAEETPEVEVPPETSTEVLVENTPAPVEEEIDLPDWSNMGQVEATPSATPVAEVQEESASGGLDALMKAVDKSSQMAEEEAAKVKLNRDDPSYIAPPNYLRTGRGLVYNCREGHWACVDKFSYFTCFENQKWNEKNSQPSECITRDVYASTGDCASIQKFYVNKPEPTDFCGAKDDASVAAPSEAQEDLSNLLAP